MKISRVLLLGRPVLLAIVLLTLGSSGWAQKGKPQPPPSDPAIAYVSRSDGLVVMNADGSNLKTLSLSIRGIHPTQPNWSPNGQQLVFESACASPDCLGGLWIINVNGTGLTMIPNTGPGFVMDPAWAPQPFGTDRLEIAYRAGNDNDVVLTNLNGTRIVNCTNTPGGAEDWAPSWSLDGTRLAVAIDAGETDLVLFRIEINAQGDPTCTFLSNLTGDGTPFADLQLGIGGVDWSKDPSKPDQIAVVADDLNGVRDIWVVYPDDPASFRNVTNGCCRPWSVSWSPDNSQLLFLDSANGTLRTIRADGTGLRTFPLSGKYLPHDYPWYGGAAWRRNK